MQFDWHFYEEGKRDTKDTQRKEHHEDGGRHWVYAAASQGMPSISGKHQKLRERDGTDSSLETSERTWGSSCPDFRLPAHRTVKQ